MGDKKEGKHGGEGRIPYISWLGDEISGEDNTAYHSASTLAEKIFREPIQTPWRFVNAAGLESDDQFSKRENATTDFAHLVGLLYGGYAGGSYLAGGSGSGSGASGGGASGGSGGGAGSGLGATSPMLGNLLNLARAHQQQRQSYDQPSSPTNVRNISSRQTNRRMGQGSNQWQEVADNLGEWEG